MSSPVKTAITPGCSRAAVVSIDSDRRVGLRGPHERRVQHAGESDVLDVGRASRDQARILLALERLPDEAVAARLGHVLCLYDAHAGSSPAAAMTALTMF